jgi:hypothetical protein
LSRTKLLNYKEQSSVPIPKIIEDLYGARYDWLMAPLEEKAQREARFEELKAQAARE